LGEMPSWGGGNLKILMTAFSAPDEQPGWGCIRRSPIGPSLLRFGGSETIDDCAGVIESLATDLSHYVTGR